MHMTFFALAEIAEIFENFLLADFALLGSNFFYLFFFFASIHFDTLNRLQVNK